MTTHDISALRTRYEEAREKAALIKRDLELVHDEADDQPLTTGQATRWRNLKTGYDRAEAAVQDAQAALGAAQSRDMLQGLQSGRLGSERAGQRSQWQQEHDGRDTAARILDTYASGQRHHDLAVSTRGMDILTDSLDQLEGEELDAMQKYIRIAGDPLYSEAFTMLMRDPSAYREFTPQQLQAYRNARQYQRALGVYGQGEDGAYLAPLQLDPSILLTNEGVADAISQLARVVTTAASVYHAVTSAGTTASFSQEATPVEDSQVQLGQPVLIPERWTAYTVASFEAFQDVNFQSVIGPILADAVAIEHGRAFTFGLGHGSFEPNGLAAVLEDGPSEYPVTGSLDRDDVLAVPDLLGPRWQANATFTSNLNVLNKVRGFGKLASSIETSLVDEGSPPSVRGYKWYVNSNLDDGSSPGDDVAVFGDLRQAYLVVNRLGSTLEVVNQVIDAQTNRPSGQRGVLAWGRTTGDVVIPEAVRLLRVSGGS